MDATQCVSDAIPCILLYVGVVLTFFLIGLFSMPVIDKVRKRYKNNRVGSCARVCYRVKRTKKLYVAAENSSTLNKVRKQMDFLNDNGNVDIKQLRLQTKDNMPEFRRSDYILCCAEQTSGRGIILSADDGPDQLGAITTHVKNKKANCAILVLGTRNPPNGLYDVPMMDKMTRKQPRLKDYRDSDRLFSFCSVLNNDQEKAICTWLKLKNRKVREKHMELVSVNNDE